jgi:L-fucose mutarotase/ribose pyranase (RbsD/FucU family)
MRVRKGKLTDTSSVSWREVLHSRLPLYGHRNWIVVADSAYPAQSSPGIETVVSNAGHLEVLREVLDAVTAARHVGSVVHIDQELQYVNEGDAPGIVAFRQQFSELFKNLEVDAKPHDQIISALDQASQTFRILIIKTDMAIPYTSVFLELQCGYWKADAESRLRAVMSHVLVKERSKTGEGVLGWPR